MPLTLKNHILAGYLHGGYDDAASITLWIDEIEKVAHLTGHSGSMVPLGGPVAPPDALSFEAIGKSAHVTTFEEGVVEAMATELQEALKNWASDGDNAEIKQDIQSILEEFDLCEFTYEEWLRENDHETLAEVYG